MRIEYLEWDDKNGEHVNRHGVTMQEARYWLVGSRGGRYCLYGQTASGRYLMVVLEQIGAKILRPVTARDMTAKEWRLYRKKVKIK